MLRYILILVWVTAFARLAAQDLTSADVRHATGNGPFPIYAVLQATYTRNVLAFIDLANAIKDRGGWEHDRHGLGGFELNVGAIINEDHFVGTRYRVRRQCFEGGYRYGWNIVDFPDAQRLRLRHEQVSLRYCRRMSIFYPFTWQVQAGTILLRSHTLAYSEDAASGTAVAAQIRQRNFFSGLDLRARVAFGDGAGSGGGIGLFVELQRPLYFNEPSANKFYPLVGLAPTASDGFESSTWSFGLLVPLALRIR
jgi:hypothetical protein